jgi:soluble lytic murein transglycosylase-like protein
MQVMYCRVLEDKIADNDAWEPELLFIPENGLDVGCGLLADLLVWAHTKTDDPAKATEAALAAYNGGRGGNDPSKDNPLRNGRYARDVLAKRALLLKEYT